MQAEKLRDAIKKEGKAALLINKAEAIVET